MTCDRATGFRRSAACIDERSSASADRAAALGPERKETSEATTWSSQRQHTSRLVLANSRRARGYAAVLRPCRAAMQ